MRTIEELNLSEELKNLLAKAGVEAPEQFFELSFEALWEISDRNMSVFIELLEKFYPIAKDFL